MLGKLLLHCVSSIFFSFTISAGSYPALKSTTPPSISAFANILAALMAADILLYDAQKVPVGKDQIQHVEMARDIANTFNNTYGDILTMPLSKVDEEVQSVLGTDGAKMSKSYGNTIDMFGTKKQTKKQVDKKDGIYDEKKCCNVLR